ncbi:MAG TPA: hypothetical protein ACFYD3_02895 [Candidatus Hypogeohydataceae bacterium YC41]
MPGQLELYEQLKPKLGEKEARDLLEFVRDAVEKGAATKEDILRLEASTKEELLNLDRKIESVKNELLKQMEILKGELFKEMNSHLRWTFAFWATAIATILLKDLLK